MVCTRFCVAGYASGTATCYTIANRAVEMLLGAAHVVVIDECGANSPASMGPAASQLNAATLATQHQLTAPATRICLHAAHGAPEPPTTPTLGHGTAQHITWSEHAFWRDSEVT